MGTFFFGLSKMFPHLIDHTVEISLLICLIFMAKLLAPKKLPPWWHYCLWLMLLVRMLVPIEFENRLNLFNFVPEVQTPNVSGFISESPVEEPQLAVQIVVREEQPKRPSLQLIIKKSLPVVWLAGAMILGICILIETISFWLSVRRKPAVTDEAILALLSECKSRMKIRRKVNIVVTDNVRSPALFGYLRPRLLLPEGVFEKLNEKELAYAFMHELGHLKRHDIGVSWLVAVLQVVHWFNPLVWLAFYQLRVDQESACDTSVLSRMKPKQSAEYAKAIVGFLEKFCQNCQLPSLAGVLENRTQMKRRIAKIVQYRKASYSLSFIALVLLSSTALALFSLTGVAAHNVESTTPVAFPETALPQIAPDINESLMTPFNEEGRMPALRGAELPTAADDVFTDITSDIGGETVAAAQAMVGHPVTSGSIVEAAEGQIQAPLQDSISVAVSEVESSGGIEPHSGQTKDSPQLSAVSGGVSVDTVSGSPESSGPEAFQDQGSGMNAAGVGLENNTPAAAYADSRKSMENDREQAPVSSRMVAVVEGEQQPASQIRPASFLESSETLRPGINIAGIEDDALMGAISEAMSSPHEDSALLADNTPMTMETEYRTIQNESATALITIPAVSVGRQENSIEAGPFTAIEVDSPPSVIKSYPPRYPYMAKRDDISGSVVLQFVVSKDGNAVDPTVVKSQPEGIFDETALRAIEQYRFKPGVKDGKAVDVKVHLPIKFTLS